MSAMKQWPANGALVSLRELVDPLIDAFHHCYQLTRRNENIDFDYRGYAFGEEEKTQNPGPSDSLKAGFLAKAFREANQTPLHVILDVAVKLGIEQGRRALRDEKRFLLRDLQRENTEPEDRSTEMSWPSDNKKTVDFEMLLRPLVGAVHHCYVLNRQNENIDFDYKGFDIGQKEQVVCMSPDERLTAEYLSCRYDGEPPSLKTPAGAIVGIAVQLGMEQGRRMLAQDPAFVVSTNRGTLKAAKEMFDQLSREEQRRVQKQLEDLLGPDGANILKQFSPKP